MVKFLQTFAVVLLSIGLSLHVDSLAFTTAPARPSGRASTVTTEKGQQENVVGAVGTNAFLKTATMAEGPVAISIVDLDNPEVRLKARRIRRRARRQQQRIRDIADADESFKMGQEMALKAVQEVYQEFNIVKKDDQPVAAAPITTTAAAFAAMEAKFEMGQEAALKAVSEVYHEYNIKDAQQPSVATATAAPSSSRVVHQQQEEIISLNKVVKGWFVKRAPILHHVLHEQKLRLKRGLKEIRSLSVTENEYALGDIFLNEGL